jgi:hypothetical protein
MRGACRCPPRRPSTRTGRLAGGALTAADRDGQAGWSGAARTGWRGPGRGSRVARMAWSTSSGSSLASSRVAARSRFSLRLASPLPSPSRSPWEWSATPRQCPSATTTRPARQEAARNRSGARRCGTLVTLCSSQWPGLKAPDPPLCAAIGRWGSTVARAPKSYSVHRVLTATAQLAGSSVPATVMAYVGGVGEEFAGRVAVNEAAADR